ncbi:hypothetical protein LTR97_004922 [Elasticomyces elasticus]|uniref:Uncharacterized protein n=1 Tax=Elasticomyces elasticus TaxID=574655 RepID=A0AAN8A3N1_9PEZI|nr:hypothetical protein LTR97_004922 [Elasticomyces elasticus]
MSSPYPATWTWKAQPTTAWRPVVNHWTVRTAARNRASSVGYRMETAPPASIMANALKLAASHTRIVLTTTTPNATAKNRAPPVPENVMQTACTQPAVKNVSWPTDRVWRPCVLRAANTVLVLDIAQRLAIPSHTILVRKKSTADASVLDSVEKHVRRWNSARTADLTKSKP